tara:strand:+ start:102 stop:377 length:276 start_codon:yes stop_codon:yes gene_type:complete
MDKINELLNEATKIDKEVNGKKATEKREKELMEEEKQTSKRIIIPITEHDLEIFKEIVDGTTTHVDWAFVTQNTNCEELINVKFTKDTEEE